MTSKEDLQGALNTVYETLMNDPLKRSMVLKLINEHKSAIEKYQAKEKRKTVTKKQSPLNNIKKKDDCLTPSSLYRKKLLKLQIENVEKCNVVSIDSPVIKPKPLDKVLENVNAYVEVSDGTVDRSSGVQLLMLKMGAKICKTLTSNVTHVIFMGGLYTTYRKATLLKVHLVSILWLDACHKNQFKVVEKDYPAINFNKSDEEMHKVLEHIESIGRNESDNIKNVNNCLLDSNPVFDYSTPPNANRSSRRSLMNFNSASKLEDCRSSFVPDFITVRKKPNKSSNLHTTNRQTMFSLTNNCFSNSSKTDPSQALSSLRISSEDSVEIKNSKITEEMSPLHITESSSDLLTSIPETPIASECDYENSFYNTRSNTKRTAVNISQKSSKKKKLSDKVVSCHTGTTLKRVRCSLFNSNDGETTEMQLSSKRISNDIIPETQNIMNRFNAICSSVVYTTKKSSEDIIPETQDILRKSSKTPTCITPSSKRSRANICNSTSNCTKMLRIQDCNEIANSSKKRKTMHLLPTTLNCTETACCSDNSSLTNYQTCSKDMSHISEKHSESVLSDSQKFNDNINNIALKRKSCFISKTPNKVRSTRKTLMRRKSMSPKALSDLNKVNDDLRINEEIISENVDKNNGKLLANDNDKCIQKSLTTTIKPKRRILFDPTQPIDSYNIDYDQELIESKNATDSVSKIAKTTNYVNLTSINLTDNSKKITNKRRDVSIQEIKNSKKEISNNLKKDNITKPFICKPINAISNKKYIDKNVKQFSQLKQKNRRSTLEFQAGSNQKSKSKLKLRKKYIVCTRFHKSDVKEFEEIVKKLGDFSIEYNVSEKTTHLVVAECKRTINVLRGIIRGCWILKKSWLLDSFKNRKWLPEEEYELTEFSPAVQQCRLQRQAFTTLYSMDIFLNCGSIYIGKNTEPKSVCLEELVSLCKGKIVNTIRRADIIIGEYIKNEFAVCLTEKWLLDSIMFNKRMEYQKYLIQIPKSPIV